MTTDDKKLEKFFNAVVGAISGEFVKFHYPESRCFNDSCKTYGVGPFWGPDRICNWKFIFHVAAWFWNHGPDVGEDWKRAAKTCGLKRPDDFHELLLEVFLGIDRGSPIFHPHSTLTLTQANFDDIKAGEVYQFRISREAQKEPQP